MTARSSGTITAVSGLPRSGTSLMMKMLEAGGLDLLVDGVRKADEDNLQGYFEFERVKKLPQGDTAWLEEANGRAVKIISALLPHLPADHHYRILFMRRKMEEILASQRQMLIRRGEPTDQVDDGRMAAIFEDHLKEIDAWVRSRPRVTLLEVSYNRLLEDPPAEIAKIVEFLGGDLDAERMAESVDPGLYRQRK